jgi:hypothetical protein
MRPPLNLFQAGLTDGTPATDAGPRGQADAEKNGAAEAKKISEGLREAPPPPAAPEVKPVCGETVAFHASPSLVRGDETAYELKLRLTPELAAIAEAWARRRLLPDPHGDDGRYRTMSLYCDTSGLDVFLRTKGYRRRKYRLRRYGEMPVVFLERKKRQGDRVAKRRDSVALDDLAYLNGVEPAADWAGAWFLERVRMRDLRPTCLVVYERMAFLGEGQASGLRLTIDRDLVGVPTREWDLSPVRGGRRLLQEGAIVELKFRDSLPPLFRELLAQLPPDPGRGVSKYRMCVRAWGLAGEER